MEVFIIEHGEKRGPFQPYEIRTRLERGELSGADHVWHDGLAAWTPIEELELFNSSEKLDLDDEPEDIIQVPELPREYLKQSEAALKNKSQLELRGGAHLTRRFFARWMDLIFYLALWWLGMYFTGQDISAVAENTWMLLTRYLPWFLIEACLLHYFGTTPGKWLMGIYVVNDDQSRLSLKASFWRSIRVLVTGLGFGYPLIIVFCQVISWFTTRRVGRPLWDFQGGHRLSVEPIRLWKTIMLILVIFGSLKVQTAVVGPYVENQLEKKAPRLKEMMGSSYWKLPPRK